MGLAPESIRFTDAAAVSPGEPHKRWGRQLGQWAEGRWALAAVGLLLLYGGYLLAWNRAMPGIWFPSAGIGLVLAAWLGRRGALLIPLAGLVAALQAPVFGTGYVWGSGMAAPLLVLLRIALDGGEAWAGWWAYQRLAGGSRRLTDPRSATLFLIIVPGLVTGLFALARTLLASLAPLAEPAFTPWSSALTTFWLGRGVGVLVVAPPALVLLTPWLVRRGWLEPETETDPRPGEPAAWPSWGERVELAVLVLAAGLLGLVIGLTSPHQGVAGWQLWGLPLLLIVWAALRQGLRGGTLVAAVGAVVPLVLACLWGHTLLPRSLLQMNLLAQCSTALLVAASASWIRGSEARYRQVVGHIPVVLYSVRVVGPRRVGQKLRAQVNFVSPASKHLLRTAPNALLGDYNRWLEHVHPDDREVVRAAVAQLERQSQPVTCEYRLAPPPDPLSDRPPANPLVNGHASRVITLQTPRQRDRWVRDTLAPQFDPDGHLEGWDGVLTDITEQRALADDLRRTTGMFHALVANLPAGVFFVKGATGRPLLVNARARQLLGQRENPAAGLQQFVQVYRLFRPDGTPYPTEELPVCTALQRGMTTICDDIVVHRPDGKRLPLVTWAAPIDLTGSGRPDAAVWVFEDLTALHQAEAARRTSEARLRTVVETMAEGLLVRDPAGQVVDHNPAACAVFGVSADGLCGRPLLDPRWHYLREDGSPLPPEEHPVRVALRTGKPVRNRILGIRLAENWGPGPGSGELPSGVSLVNGSAMPVRWVLVNVMPFPLGAGGVVETYADVTAHRQALEVLRASEEKYHGLVDTLPLILVQLDADLRITYANPATQAISGYSLEELHEPAQWLALLAPEDQARARAAAAEVLAGRPVRTEVRYQAKDGNEKTAYCILQPRWQGESVAGATILAVDVTRERRLEQELQRAQRLELIGRLSSGIAHDFNNLLTVILSLADLARTQVPEDHPISANLGHILDAGEQAANLASQLLAFSKQKQVTARRVDLNRIADRALGLLAVALPDHITLHSGLADDSLWVLADETQLQQVLMNLCLNARDAMPEGGRLEVRTELVRDPTPEAAELPAGRHAWVRLSVTDTGQGMTDNIKARIFDPFFSTKERGTGLGLSVVQQIISACGGRVEVWSQPGQGSRFDVWLPCA